MLPPYSSVEVWVLQPGGKVCDLAGFVLAVP